MILGPVKILLLSCCAIMAGFYFKKKEKTYLEFVESARKNTPDPDQKAALLSSVPPVANYPKFTGYTELPDKFRVF